jgi:hypothetical protein
VGHGPHAAAAAAGALPDSRPGLMQPKKRALRYRDGSGDAEDLGCIFDMDVLYQMQQTQQRGPLMVLRS